MNATLEDDGHWFVLDWVSWAKSLVRLEGLFEIIYFLNERVLGREIIRVFFCGHMKCRSISYLVSYLVHRQYLPIEY